MSSVFVAVDLGGTNVRAARTQDSLPIRLGRIHKGPSHARDGVEATVAAIERVVRAAAGKAQIGAVGVAVAGHVDGRVVRWSPNFGKQTKQGFQMWRNVPLATLLERRLEAPVVLGNDANTAALGEYWFGAGQGTAHSLFLFTLGTGVGSGYVLKGEMFTGFRGGAVEFGHTVIEQSDEPWLTGSPGPVEAFCGARAFEMRFGATPKALAEKAKKGDAAARDAWKRYGGWLGSAVGGAINAFAPEIVALGGGIARAADLFLPSCLAQVRRVAVPSIARNTKIVLAERMDDAALYGAIALVKERST